MGVSSTITTSFALMLLIGVMANILTLSSDVRYSMVELADWLNGYGCLRRSAYLVITSINGSRVTASLLIDGDCGLTLRDLASSEIYAYYRLVQGGGGFSRLRPGQEWRVSEVTGPAGVELLNPSSPALWEGVLDPGEEARMELSLPSDFDPSYGVVLVLVTPGGDRVVGAG
ncbi:MAG: hypothetical protein QXZ00_04370 [Nitrososphaerota archaeon]